MWEVSEAQTKLREAQAELQETKQRHSDSHLGKELSLLHFEFRGKISALEHEKNTLKAQLSQYQQVCSLREALLAALSQVNTELAASDTVLASSLSTALHCLQQLEEVGLEPTSRILQVQNLRLQGEVQSLTSETVRLKRLNSALEADVIRLKKNEELHLHLEHELTRRAKIWQKLVKSSEPVLESSPFPHLPNAEPPQERVTALERETLRLRKALSRKQSEAKITENILALLSHYVLRKADTKESEDANHLLRQDFRTLTLLQKQQLAEFILAQAHDFLRKSQELPPLLSPQRPDLSSNCDFDLQQLSIALKPRPRPQRKK